MIIKTTIVLMDEFQWQTVNQAAKIVGFEDGSTRSEVLFIYGSKRATMKFPFEQLPTFAYALNNGLDTAEMLELAGLNRPANREETH